MSFDPSAVLFSVASEKLNCISLYDVRNFDKQPFSVFKLDTNNRPWSKVEFSNNGKTVLVSTLDDTHYLLDSFQGEVVAKLGGHSRVPRPAQRNSGHTCFSQDGRFVFSGSGDKRIYVWDTRKATGHDARLRPIKSFDSPHPPALLAMNPKTMVLATANTELTLWLPSMNNKDK